MLRRPLQARRLRDKRDSADRLRKDPADTADLRQVALVDRLRQVAVSAPLRRKTLEAPPQGEGVKDRAVLVVRRKEMVRPHKDRAVTVVLPKAVRRVEDTADLRRKISISR